VITRIVQVLGPVGWFALALWVQTPNGLGETLRVTTWNLEPATAAGRTNAAAGTNQTPNPQAAGTFKKASSQPAKGGGGANAAGMTPIRIRQASAALKKLDPDVILLQQVRDRKTCDQLVQALKPAEYKILVCSSFTDARTGTLRKRQVAILSKAKAYFAWSEPWRNKGKTALPGGLAFAALQVGKQRVGFLSVQAAGAPAKSAGPEQGPARLKAQAASVSQLLEQVSAITKWVTNRVEVFVVGGTFNPGTPNGFAAQDLPLRLLESAGFDDAFPRPPGAEPASPPSIAGQPGGTVDYIFTRPAGRALNPRMPSAPAFLHNLLGCDVELDPAKVVAAQPTRSETLPASEAPPSRKADEVKAEPKPVQAAPTPPPTQPVPLAPAAATGTSTLRSKATEDGSALKPQLLWLTAAALGGMLAAAALAWMLARQRRAFPPVAPALITERTEGGDDAPSSYTVVVGTRSAAEEAPADADPSSTPRAMMHLDAPETHTHTEVLRQRALAAEQRADRATAVIRAGLIPHLGQWLRHKLVRKLVADRAQLLETQQLATRKALAVEERLARIEQQIQRQNHAYQERIEELTRELLVAKEDNRELIRARIAQVKQDMEAARARLMAQSVPDDTPLP
jgi:hypothetical protein